jgi:hypothetical protein
MGEGFGFLEIVLSVTYRIGSPIERTIPSLLAAIPPHDDPGLEITIQKNCEPARPMYPENAGHFNI